MCSCGEWCAHERKGSGALRDGELLCSKKEVTYTLWWGEAGRSIARGCMYVCVCSVCMSFY